MNPDKLFPLIITDRLAETRAYYVDKAGFEVVHDLPGYLQVRYGDESGPELCFMAPEDPSPMGEIARFAGEGVIISIPTEDADAKYGDMVERGARAGEPSDKPWGWRSFIAVDPNGLRLDFFHVKEASEATA